MKTPPSILEQPTRHGLEHGRVSRKVDGLTALLPGVRFLFYLYFERKRLSLPASKARGGRNSTKRRIRVAVAIGYQGFNAMKAPTGLNR